MSKSNFKTANIIMLVIILAILIVGVYTATQEGTYINVLVSKAKVWQFVVSAIGFLGTAGLIIKYSKDSKEGIGFTIGKALTILASLVIAIGVFYI